ncbi:MAG: DegT/DnrJ/EryC1/StrS family aminotransferase [FCB group bacterium]|jgi:8-amino-3,8-dideoxy-alpha-D-manno-octulosonate transaminase|nr:DegT/DnrJ/EryC1/StrS family aminotransferase [FCB group bacterium]
MTEKLAIDGGSPVVREPLPEIYGGAAEIGEEEIAAVTEVLRTRPLFRFLDIETSRCAELERLFAGMTGCNHALAVGGGTAALISALAGIGVGDGDEVIVPGYTYIASAAAVVICGGVPVIAEIDETLTLDPQDVERKITKRTRAIMPVHMRGYPCNMDAIMDIAKRHNLLVIEDVAQACGGSYKGRRLGSIGNVGCFSLQHYKVITAGEGGMVVTNDRDIFDRSAIRHDSAMCYWKPGESSVRPFAGENFRMNEMEGALGCVQFTRLEGILERSRSICRRLDHGLQDVPGVRLHRSNDPAGNCGICFTFFVRDSNRAKQFAEALRAEGVPAGCLFDKGIPDRHVYPYWEYVMEKASQDRHGRPWTSPLHDPDRTYSPDMCPNTLEILGRAVMLTISQALEDKHVEWVIQAIRKVAGSRGE